MTQTIAIIINAVLMAGIAAAVAYFIGIPFRLARLAPAARVASIRADEDDRELSRAA